MYLRKEVRNSSLDPVYDGPFLVSGRRGANVLLKMQNGEQMVHLNRCKKCVNREQIPDAPPIPTAPSVAGSSSGSNVEAEDRSTRDPGPVRRDEEEVSQGVLLHCPPSSVVRPESMSELGDTADHQMAARRRYPSRARRQPQFLRL